MTSRYGSQALADGLRPGCGPARAESAGQLSRQSRWITSASLAGFAGCGVGGHLVGRFCRRSPSPPAWRPHRDPGRSQISRRRFPTDAGALLNAPQRPSQPPQRDDLLFLFFVQDIAHIDGGYRPRVRVNVLDCGLSLAGFQVTTYGRFWV